VSKLTLEIPDRLAPAFREAPAIDERELRMIVAVKLHELGRLSAGAAAELAGISKPLFLSRLGDYGVDAFRLTDEELRQETRLA